MKIGHKFITDVYTFINTIDKTQMIMNSSRYREIMFVDGEDNYYYNFNSEMKSASYDDELYALHNFNFKYANNLTEKNGDVFTPSYNVTKYSIHKMTYMLMLYAFEVLKIYFEIEIDNFYTEYSRREQMNVNQEEIENQLLKMFDTLCNVAPYGIFYLKENGFSDNVLFGLYLLFCSH